MLCAQVHLGGLQEENIFDRMGKCKMPVCMVFVLYWFDVPARKATCVVTACLCMLSDEAV